jgi:hypothetical protein
MPTRSSVNATYVLEMAMTHATEPNTNATSRLLLKMDNLSSTVMGSLPFGEKCPPNGRRRVDHDLRDSGFGFETENWGAGGIVLKRVFPFTIYTCAPRGPRWEIGRYIL